MKLDVDDEDVVVSFTVSRHGTRFAVRNLAGDIAGFKAPNCFRLEEAVS